MGTVSSLLVKPTRHGPMHAVNRIVARADHGIDGDCHAGPLGPRQVLVVRDEDLAELGILPEQLRANVSVRGLDRSAFTSGAVLSLGRSARIRITHECEVCSVLREHVPPGTFPALAGRRGWLGVVLSGGPLEAGDGVRLEAERYPRVPDDVYGRFAWVLERLPWGRVATYAGVMALVGATRAHARVLPTYLKRAEAAGLPAHRVLTSSRELSRHLPAQAGRLAAEGVGFDGARLADPARLWDGRAIYREP